MTGIIEDDVLRFEGLNDQDIADLNSILDDLEILNTALNAQMPRIQKVTPIITRIIAKIIAKQKELKS